MRIGNFNHIKHLMVKSIWTTMQCVWTIVDWRVVFNTIQHKQPFTDAEGVRRQRYPFRQFWELAAEIGGIEVVCSSDAHTPSALWRAVPELLALADELGFPVVNERLAAEIPVK